MNIEKLCGAVIYRKLGEAFEFLTVKSKANGHWDFLKGHMRNKIRSIKLNYATK